MELIHCELEDNSATTYSEIDSELLLESLKKTMMLGKEYDEYYISFE